MVDNNIVTVYPKMLVPKTRYIFSQTFTEDQGQQKIEPLIVCLDLANTWLGSCHWVSYVVLPQVKN